MEPSQEPTEADDGVDILDRPIGAFDRWHIEEHQDHAGHHEDEEDDKGDGAEVERIRKRQATQRYPIGEPVKEEVGDDAAAGLAVGLRVPRPGQPLPKIMH